MLRGGCAGLTTKFPECVCEKGNVALEFLLRWCGLLELCLGAYKRCRILVVSGVISDGGGDDAC